MTIPMNWAGALAEGLLGGIAGYAKGQYAQNEEDKKAQRDADTAAAKAKADMAIHRMELGLAKPEISNIHATDDQGNPVERSISQTFDPTANNGDGGWKQNTLGEAPVPKKPPVTREIQQGNQSTTQQFNEGTGKWDVIGSGPKWDPRAPGGGADGLSAKQKEFQTYSNLSPEQRSMYDRMNGRADPELEDKKNANLARAATIKELRDKEMMGTPVTDADRANVLYDNQSIMGVDPFKSVRAATTGTANVAPAAPAQQGGKPTPQQIMAQASAAVAAGAPQGPVEARMKQLMQQYGYQPQDSGQ